MGRKVPQTANSFDSKEVPEKYLSDCAVILSGTAIAMPPKKRRAFSAAFKLSVIERARDLNSNRAAAKEFDVDEKSVRMWGSAEALLKEMSAKKKARRHKAPAWPKPEEKVAAWVRLQREVGRTVSTVRVRLVARSMAAEEGL